jgi:transcriptional regulator with XRE-family HTH domain
MTVAARLLRHARHSTPLSQSALAAKVGFRQSNVSRLESEGRDVNVDTLDRLLRAAGFRLAALPTQSAAVAEAADSTARFVAADNEDGAYRAVIQLADDLAREHGAMRVALTVAPPPPTGDERFDAFIAGVVDFRLAAEGLPRPKWLTDGPRLDSPWFVDRWSIGNSSVVEATPPQLRTRGVIIDAAELASV